MIEEISLAFKEDDTRKIYIYLPNEIEDDTRRYPVLYMFDGHNIFEDEKATFGKSWGMKQYLDAMNLPLIVVGIESNRNPNNDRLKEYAPFSFYDRRYGSIDGLGDYTMEFLLEKVKPLIDENYPTNPFREYTFIGGSSMGGLMSLYAITKYNAYFSKAISLSPSLWTKPYKINELIKNANFDENTVVYMDYGSRELNNHKSMLNYFRKTQNILLNKNIFVTSRIVPNGEHSEASWEKQLNFIFEILFYELEI